jgi:hypothetical protein
MLAEILRIQATICHKPHDSHTTGIRVIGYVSGIVPIVAVSMRFASRWLGGNSFWWDDWLHLVSAVSLPSAVTFNITDVWQDSDYPPYRRHIREC